LRPRVARAAAKQALEQGGRRAFVAAQGQHARAAERDGRGVGA
jgi:hypothetical protein